MSAATTLAKRAGLAEGQLKLICIISAIIGATALATTALVAVHLARHRRRRNDSHFLEACLRDPSLTWDEYERKGRLTRSRLGFEEELQRAEMIRKSQQSRTSERKDHHCYHNHQNQSPHDTGPTPGAPAPSVSPSRTQSWHGRSRVLPAHGGGGGGGAIPYPATDAEAAAGATKEMTADWTSVHASVERTWQLLHGGRKLSTTAASASQANNGGMSSFPSSSSSNSSSASNVHGTDEPSRPPTVRLKTPPLLAHPIFRDANAHYRPTHMSLPTELARAKTEPVPLIAARPNGVARKQDDLQP